MDRGPLLVLFAIMWFMAGLVAGLVIQHENQQISQQETCPVIGTHLLDNGAVLVVRECEDGTLVREYPWPNE